VLHAFRIPERYPALLHAQQLIIFRLLFAQERLSVQYPARQQKDQY
jgi:hypothetical protein